MSLMVYLAGIAYLLIAVIFYGIGRMTTDSDVYSKPGAALAAVFWPISVVVVGAYAIYDRYKHGRQISSSN
jgi:hypothetical protein